MRRTKLGVGVGAAIAAAVLVAVPIVGAAADSPERSAPRLAQTPASALAEHPLEAAAQAEAVQDYIEALMFWDFIAELEEAMRPRSSGGGGCAPGDWECFKACTIKIESGGSYGAASRNGTYRGAYQFDQRTWDSNAAASGRHDLVGQDPAGAAPTDQDQIAHDTYQRRGKSPWGGRC